MTFIDNKKELEKYAKAYALKTAPNSLKNLAFKHLPALFKKYHINSKALDFGCGAGYSTNFLKSLGFNTVGVDINPKMLEAARANDVNGNYQSIVNSKIPHNDNAFDLVFSSFVLLEMSSLEQIEKALMEISRVLKPNAHFVTIVGNENTYKYKWSVLNTDFPQNKILKSGKKVKVEFIDKGIIIEDYYWTQEDYLGAMKKANLELLEIYNPLAAPNDGINWGDETRFSPSSIYFMKKS